METDQGTTEAQEHPAAGPAGVTGDTGGPTGPGYRRIYRRLDDRMVAGVASGLGDYFGIDPILFRIAFVALTFAGGLGVLLYLLGWWIIPPARAGLPSPRREPLPERALQRLKGSPAWVGVALLVLGAAILAGEIGIGRPGIFWGVALIALGILLYREGSRPRQPPAAPPGGSGESSPAGNETDRTPISGQVPLPAAAPWEVRTRERPADAPPSPPGPRERSALGWLALGAALLAVGVAALLDGAKVVDLRPHQFPALAVAVLGLGLVAGAWVGRARWLIVPALLLMPVVVVASLIRVPFEGGFDERLYRPQALSEVQSEYHLVAGEMVIDLTALPLEGRTASLQATVVAGRIVVLVPPGTSVEAVVRAGAGRVEVLGATDEGFDAEVVATSALPSADGSGLLHLDLEAAMGEVLVLRAAPEGEEVPE